jgi:hypothetical protein
MIPRELIWSEKIYQQRKSETREDEPSRLEIKSNAENANKYTQQYL